MDEMSVYAEPKETEGVDHGASWIIIRVLICFIILATFGTGLVTGIIIGRASADERHCYVLSGPTMFPVRDPECRT